MRRPPDRDVRDNLRQVMIGPLADAGAEKVQNDSNGGGREMADDWCGDSELDNLKTCGNLSSAERRPGALVSAVLRRMLFELLLTTNSESRNNSETG